MCVGCYWGDNVMSRCSKNEFVLIVLVLDARFDCDFMKLRAKTLILDVFEPNLSFSRETEGKNLSSVINPSVAVAVSHHNHQIKDTSY